MPGPDLGFHGGDLRAAAGDSWGLLMALLGDLIESAPLAVQRTAFGRVAFL
jgi:hypothetical protein